MAYATTLQKPDQNPHSLDAPLSVGGSVCLYTASTWRMGYRKLDLGGATRWYRCIAMAGSD